jgi:hypothetical protein
MGMRRSFIYNFILLAFVCAPAFAGDNSSGESGGGLVCRTAEGDHGLRLACGDNATKQTANVPSTTIATTSRLADRFYRITCAVLVTKAAASSTMPACNFGYTDETGTSHRGIQMTATGGTGSSWGSATFFAKANTAVDYGTSGYADSGTMPMNYSVHVVLEQIW